MIYRTLRKPMILFGNDLADEMFASTLKRSVSTLVSTLSICLSIPVAHHRKERELALSAGNREPNTDLKPVRHSP